jgi:glycosyltransferase involved in cell wall biosynthesis
VIIPAYNAEKTLERCVKSVLNQTIKPNEIIIINDGSEDKTSEVIESLANTNNLIKHLFQSNAGVSKSRNRGIMVAESTQVMFLDADDYWIPTKIEAHMRHLNEHETCSASFTNYFIEESLKSESLFRNNSKNLYPITKQNIALARVVVHGSASSMVCRRNIFAKIEGFDANLKFGEDLDMWVRLAQNFEICEINKYETVIVRDKNSSQGRMLTKNKSWLITDMYLYIWSKNKIPFDSKTDKKNARLLLRIDLRKHVFSMKKILCSFPLQLQKNDNKLFRNLYSNYPFYLFFLYTDIRYDLIVFLRKLFNRTTRV